MEKVWIEHTLLVFQTSALTNSAIFPYFNHHFAESRRIELYSLMNQLLSRQCPAQQDLLSNILWEKYESNIQGLKATVLQTAPLPLTDYFPLIYCKHDGIRTAAADRPYWTVSETGLSSDWSTRSFNFCKGNRTRIARRPPTIPLSITYFFCGGSRNRTHSTNLVLLIFKTSSSSIRATSVLLFAWSRSIKQLLPFSMRIVLI